MAVHEDAPAPGLQARSMTVAVLIGGFVAVTIRPSAFTIPHSIAIRHSQFASSAALQAEGLFDSRRWQVRRRWTPPPDRMVPETTTTLLCRRLSRLRRIRDV